MKPETLRARVALWTVAVVSGALIIFGAGAAWNLRRELIENLDEDIKTEMADFLSEVNEQDVDWNQPKSVEHFLNEDAQRFRYLEIHDAAGHLFYRSPTLSEQEIVPERRGDRAYGVDQRGQSIRFGISKSKALQVTLGKDMKDVRETLAGLTSAYLFTLPLVILAVGAGSWWIAHRAAVPVRLIAAQAENISASDLHQRIPTSSSHDEIADLTVVLNAMFDRLERSFEQVTRFTSDASHELKTPVALMRAQLETALGSGDIAPPQRELLSDLIEQCSQLSHIVDGLLFLSRADDKKLAIQQSPIDLAALVHDLREDAEILAAEADLTLQYDLPAQLIVTADVRLLRRAVMNLIDNAIKYNRAGGTVVLSASKGNDNEAVLTVRNTGAGIQPAAREKIFERFYRSDSSQMKTSGHGLGLSIAREIARAHLGHLTLVPSDTRWTEFRLVLPTTAPQSSR